MRIITRIVRVPYSKLTSKIHEHVLSQIKEDVLDECTEEYGYVISVDRVLSIEENEDNYFRVRFQAETFKPAVGDDLDCTIVMVSEVGIFARALDRQNILIPVNSLSDFQYDADRQAFVFDTRNLSKGTQVQVTVTNTKYFQNYFSCIGELKENPAE